MKKDIKKINSILLNAIDTEFNISNLEPVKYLFARYNDEYNHDYNKRQYPNEQNRLANWLQGLPSVINLPFIYNDIINFYKEVYNITLFTEKQQNRLIKNYYNFIAYHLIKLNK